MGEKHEAVLHQLRDAQADLGRWTELQTQINALRSELDNLRACGAVGTKILDASDQNGSYNHVHGAMEASITGPTGGSSPGLSLAKGYETHLAGFQRELLSSKGESKVLQRRVDVLEADQSRYQAEINHLRLRDTAYSTLLKELDVSNKAIKAYVQNQSELVMKAQELSIDSSAPLHGEVVVSAAPQLAYEQEAANSNDGSMTPVLGVGKVTGQQNPRGYGSMPRLSVEGNVAVPQVVINDINPDAQIVSPVATKTRKRTLSELLEDERDASSDYQRRRTGFANYVGLSNPAWKGGMTSTLAGKDFGSSQGDFYAPPLVTKPALPVKSDGAGVSRSILIGTDIAPHPSFSATKIPLETSSSSLLLASISLPPSPAKESFRNPEKTSDSSEDDEAPSQVFHFRSNTQEQSPWKVPRGPRRWQNSVLRKDR